MSEKLRQVYARFQAVRPAPDAFPIEKVFGDPFMSLVGVALSAQTRDERTAEACDRLFAVARTPEQILALEPDALRDLIRPVGMYNVKARNLLVMCRQLLERHGGLVPNDRQMLMALTGIGRKSTDIMMRFVFNQPAIAVDTHVHRISNRLGVAKTKSEAQTAVILERDTPDEYRWSAHEWLIDHGKYICRARNPLCEECMFLDICDYYSQRVR